MVDQCYHTNMRDQGILLSALFIYSFSPILPTTAWLSRPEGGPQVYTYHRSAVCHWNAKAKQSRSPLEASNSLPWSEIWIDQSSALPVDCHSQREFDECRRSTSPSSSEGTRIQQGKSVILLRSIVNRTECEDLAQRCIHVAQESQRFELEHKSIGSSTSDIPKLVRLPTQAAARRANIAKITCSHPLPRTIDVRVQDILRRACEAIDSFIPSLSLELLESDSLTDLFHQSPSLESSGSRTAGDKLTFSAREPAVNVYSAPGGEFLPHKDGEALTILLPLSSPEQDFSGGGTAFWSSTSVASQSPASVVLKPPAGAALVFGGSVTHAGMPVISGTRVVIVCSVSRRHSSENDNGASAAADHDLLDKDDSLSALLANAAADWHDRWTAASLQDSCPDM